MTAGCGRFPGLVCVEIRKIYSIGEFEDGLRLAVVVTCAGVERLPIEFRQFDLDCIDDGTALAPDERPTLKDQPLVDFDWDDDQRREERRATDPDSSSVAA